MKRLINKFILLIAGILFASNSFAGVNYIEYHKNFQTQKEEMKNSVKEEHFQQSNESFHEQQSNVVTPSKECNRNRMVHKYDYCYWNPTK